MSEHHSFMIERTDAIVLVTLIVAIGLVGASAILAAALILFRGML